MTAQWRVTGPALEVGALAQELRQAAQLGIEGPFERRAELNDDDALLASPVTELLISYAAGVGTVATTEIFKGLARAVLKRRDCSIEHVEADADADDERATD